MRFYFTNDQTRFADNTLLYNFGNYFLPKNYLVLEIATTKSHNNLS